MHISAGNQQDFSRPSTAHRGLKLASGGRRQRVDGRAFSHCAGCGAALAEQSIARTCRTRRGITLEWCAECAAGQVALDFKSGVHP
jgi:hypothetical protein